MRSRAEALAWEERWSLPVAIATLLAVVLSIAGTVLLAQAIGGSNGDAEYLRQVDQHRGDQIVASVLQAIGAALLAAPLVFLFRADQARSSKVRGQLIGLIVAAPIFIAVFNVLVSVSALHAASDFVGQAVTGTGDHADKVAKEAIENAPLQALAAGFGIAGRLGFIVAMFYSCLYGLRTGLLSRFWGSLGMALGAVSFIFPQFAVLWFIYLGLLIAGWIPGGRPPAWAAGEAIPPPSPGEKMAAQLEPKEDEDDSDSA
jgi:ABC-type multidrug transport system fused ATPase/permease subunit